MELEEEKEEKLVAAMPSYEEEITELIRSRLAPKPMAEKLAEYHSNDIALALGMLTEQERKKLYRLIDDETLSDVLEYAEEDRDTYISELELRRRISALSKIEISDAADYLNSLEKSDKSAIMGLLPDEIQEELELISSFDETEIGSRMSTNYISVQNGIGVREAMRQLVSQAAENDNVSTIYVVDGNGIFVGAITLKDLVVARASTPLDDIIMTSFPYVYAFEPVDECLDRVRSYSEDSIPVLNSENKLVGVLTAQELVQVIEEEIVDDYAKLGGLSAEEELREPIFRSVGKRLPWLAILFGLGLLVSWVVGRFETVAKELPVIVAFQSLILGMAGNVGTQSLAVTIRLLSDERVTKGGKIYLIFKEARVGLLNGAILGLSSFILVGAYLFLVNGNAMFAFSVSLCIGVALLTSMLLSGIFGASIPITLKRLGVDPAVASGPFITTVNDLVAVVTYYGLAWLLLLQI